ncbi:MAG TPA: hypothetical protein VIW29_03325 [Polyangiaceae bacterium]
MVHQLVHRLPDQLRDGVTRHFRCRRVHENGAALVIEAVNALTRRLQNQPMLALERLQADLGRSGVGAVEPIEVDPTLEQAQVLRRHPEMVPPRRFRCWGSSVSARR